MIDPRSEIVFWTGIMRDHAKFQLSALPSSETYYIQNSTQYLNYFQQILNRLESGEALEGIYTAVVKGLDSFIEYKKLLLKGLLTCRLEMNLPPSLINHMINEAMEFRMLLAMSSKNEMDTPLLLVNRIRLWLADSVGHAAGLAAFLDPSEALLTEELTMFKESFNNLMTKASELEMMVSETFLKANSIEYLGEETVDMMERFICLLEKIRKLRAYCKVLGLGTLSPMLPDHMIREHRYYIASIKMSRLS